MSARAYIRLLLSLLILIALFVVMLASERRREAAVTILQTQQREHQQVQQALIQLQANQAAGSLEVVEAGVEAVRLNLLESLIQINELPEIVDMQFTIGDSGGRSGRSGRSGRADYLRTTLHLELMHAEALLTLVAHLDSTSSVWPHLLRGCAVRRQEPAASPLVSRLARRSADQSAGHSTRQSTRQLKSKSASQSVSHSAYLSATCIYDVYTWDALS